jgi:type I restriction enzyme R subunit
MAVNPPTPDEWESAIAARAAEAYRQGYLLLAVAPDLQSDKADSLLSKVFRYTKRKYASTNRAIATQEVIEELINLAKQMDAATKRGQDLGLNDDEIAFYDALAANESAVKAMGSAELRVIAAELVTQVRKSVTIDWTFRESARAKIKVLVKRILKKHGYPPDLQEEATKTVLAQAELLCQDWGNN